jgi:hypothetical protein
MGKGARRDHQLRGWPHHRSPAEAIDQAKAEVGEKQARLMPGAAPIFVRDFRRLPREVAEVAKVGES